MSLPEVHPMRHCQWAVLSLAFLAGVALVFTDRALLAQANQGIKAKEGVIKQVDILTVDRVELKAKYFPSGKANAPCVMMLHALGESCSDKEWTNLAKKLQAKGFAVLMFDFRGHGDSTTVQPGVPPNPKNPKQPALPGFWDEMLNQRGIKGFAATKPRPTEIKYEQFLPAYCTFLANDIAAAKAFLDEQPDCNSSNLILIGANDGANLGALWLNSEWNRFRYLPPAPGLPQGSLDRQNPEGIAVKAAVWLSVTSTLGTSKTVYNVAQMLERPGKQYKMPMIFVYGEGDAKAKDLAKACEKFMITTTKNKKDYPYTAAVQIDGAEKMSGKKLLFDSLPTTAKILEFLANVVDWNLTTKGRKATDDDFLWEVVDRSTGRILQQPIARKKGASRVEFSSYASFLR
jgi:pimeloyl-ACP methyl ester carboxylesterase